MFDPLSLLNPGRRWALKRSMPAGAALATVNVVRADHVPVRNKPCRIAHLTDTHVQPESHNGSGFARALASVQSLRPRPDLILTGVGQGYLPRLEELKKRRATVEHELADLETRLKQERGLVKRFGELRDKLEQAQQVEGPGAAGSKLAAKSGQLANSVTPALIEEWRKELADVNAQLRELQGEVPLLQPCVDRQAIAEVVGNWTGIPVGRMVSNEIRAVLTLKQRMAERIVGQEHALEMIAQAIRTSRAKLTDPRKPTGVFLLVGPSGVGKTETALALADLLYGGEQNITVINMSEFKEEHKVSMLVGSPPGYVGYGEGGVLTEAVRRRPYSVILLDEMEKAHPGIQDVFYQVFDKGMLRDGEGRDIDFKNTVIVMASNAGTDTIHRLCADDETTPDAAGLADALRSELRQTFRPAFLGRVTLVPYFPLNEEMMRQIVELQLKRIGRRVAENYGAQFTYDVGLIEGIAQRCKEVDTGARNIDHILTRSLLPEMSEQFLSRMAESPSFKSVHVLIDASGSFQYNIA